MIKDKIKKLFPTIDTDSEYFESLCRRYTEFLRYSELPLKFHDVEIDKSYIPKKAQTLLDNMYEAVTNRYNLLLNFESYMSSGPLATVLMHEYFIQCETNRGITSNILYVDTNLLLEDYKRLMNYKPDTDSYIPVHSLPTLYRSVEESPVIIWDRFSKIESAYDRNKIYEILLIRYRKGLGNFFLITGGSRALCSVIGKDIADLMGTDFTIDCSQDDYALKFI